MAVRIGWYMLLDGDKVCLVVIELLMLRACVRLVRGPAMISTCKSSPSGDVRFHSWTSNRAHIRREDSVMVIVRKKTVTFSKTNQ